MHDEGTLLES